MNAASAGDTIFISNGVYELTSGRINIEKELTLVGVPEDNPPVFDGMGNRQGLSNTAQAHVTLRNLRFTNCKLASTSGAGARLYDATLVNCVFDDNDAGSSQGGGVYISGSGVIERCTFAFNKARDGAGLRASSAGYLRISETVFATNTATRYGGGVYLTNAYGVVVSDSLFIGNSCTSSGGGYNSTGPGEANTPNYVIRSDFIRNNSGYGSGGIHCKSDGDFANIIESCNIVSNTTVNFGGGVLLSGPSVVRDSYVYGNKSTSESKTATHGGGGVHLSNGALAENCHIEANVGHYSAGGVFINGSGSAIRNSLIVSNQCLSVGSTYGGGGMRVRYETGNSIENCTIVGNDSVATGGGVYMTSDAGNNAFVNTIVYFNTHDGDAGSTHANFRNNGGTPTFTNSLVGAVFAQAVLDVSTGLINENPRFMPGEFRLQGGSPCVDAGMYLPWMDGAFDMYGKERINPSSGLPDMGCYEHYPVGTLVIVR